MIQCSLLGKKCKVIVEMQNKESRGRQKLVSSSMSKQVDFETWWCNNPKHCGVVTSFPFFPQNSVSASDDVYLPSCL
jgi:hypothetical protein